jgi:hypothetical protein
MYEHLDPVTQMVRGFLVVSAAPLLHSALFTLDRRGR